MAMKRMTTQRLKILAFLKTTHTHPTAEGIHKHVIKELPSITLATTYRNLNKLVEEGIITRLKVGNAYHYDGQEGTHAHGICTRCGNVIDLKQRPQLHKELLKTTNEAFTPTDVRIIYTGTCKDCTRGETP